MSTTSTNLPPLTKLRSNEKCEKCGHKGYCMYSPTIIWCMFNPDGAYSTRTDKAGVPAYLHRRDGVIVSEPYRPQHEARPNWTSANPLGCTYLYTMMATDFARADIPAQGLAADADRFGVHAEAVRAVADAFYLADPDGLLRRIAAEGRTQDAKNAGLIYPDDHEHAGQLVRWLKNRKLYAWREGDRVRELRGRAIGPSTHKVLSLAGSRADRGADGFWYQHRNLAACGGHIRIAGGHEKADALNVAGLLAVGSNEGQASDAMIAALTAAGVILATLHIDGEDPKEGRSLSEGQRLGLAIGDRLELAGIAVRVAEPLRSPSEPKIDADSMLRDHGPEALRDIDARAVPLSLFRRRLGINPTDHDTEHTKRLQEALQKAYEEVGNLRELQAAMMHVQRNKHIKTEKPTLLAATYLYNSEASRGKVDEDGWLQTTRAALAEIGGTSEDKVGDDLDRIDNWGVGIHKDTRYVEVRQVDPDGQVHVERHKRIFLKVDGKPADVLMPLGGDFNPPRPVDKTTGKEIGTHGGKRESCPRCGGTTRRTVITCADCGIVYSDRTDDVGEPEDVPLTVIEPSRKASHPHGEVTYEYADDEDPLPLADACWHQVGTPHACTNIVRPSRQNPNGPQHCEFHQPEAMAKRQAATFAVKEPEPQHPPFDAPAPHLPPPVPVSEPVPDCPTLSDTGPFSWDTVPRAAQTGPPGCGCTICDEPLRFVLMGRPLLCKAHRDEYDLWANGLAGYADAAGGG